MDPRNLRRFIVIVFFSIAFAFIGFQGCDDITAPAQYINSDAPPEPGGENPGGDGPGTVIEPQSSYIGVTDDGFFVQQDDSQCGPASFYMIFRYYDDPCSGATLSTTAECVASTILSGITEVFSIVLDTSWMSDWLDSASDGVDCRNFYGKISALSRCAEGTGLPFYSTVDGNCGLTDEEPDDFDAGANAERRERFDYIVETFLKNNYPVIIHLNRMYDGYLLPWYPGHYVVLMGYDTATREVYIMDPFQPYDTHSVMTVPYDSFIMARWYQSTGSLAYLYPDARWDGTWIGFHH